MKSDCDSLVQWFLEGAAERSFQMCLVSDGAGKEQNMSSFGSCQSSFHVEAYGALSGAQFIYHVSILKNSQINWTIKGSAENEGLIKQVNKQLTYSGDHPSNTLESKWDLIKQIAVTIQSMEEQPKISHVQGHQDNDTLYKELDWRSQQNIDANHLAREFLEKNGEVRVLVPHVAVIIAQITIQG
eukprot:9769825-Ditylum_brightwellii.AAC.1